MGWKLTLGDQVWSEEDVTVADAVVVVELLERDDWQVLTPAASPRACVAFLSVLLMKVSGDPIGVAQAAVMSMPLRVLVDTLSFDDPAPTVPPAPTAPPEPPADPADDRQPRRPRTRSGAGQALATV